MQDPSSPQPGQRIGATSAALALWLIIVTTIALLRLAPPPVAPASAPPAAFSAQRALAHVETIAQEPHPIGSEAHARVREYLVGQLEALNLEPEVQETVAIGRVPTFAGTAHNVLARLEGSASQGAILLVAHYDSIPDGPGASDDGAAVAAMLETARALQEGPPLQNDVIFLFTDGEETGMLGAKAFVDEHPWAEEVGLVLNFEARGHYGPSLMFETSQANGWLIEQFAQAAPMPQSSSLFFEVYQFLPNDTDFSVFRRAGMQGYNFAFMSGETHYHTTLDTIENLDPRSLQHHGSSMLALTRQAGNQPLPPPASDNAVYFSLLGATVIHYPGGWAPLLALLVALLTLGTIGYGLRGGQLTWKGMGAGFLLLGLLVGLTYGLVFLLWLLIGLLHPNYSLMRSGDTYNSLFYVGGFSALTLALGAALYGAASRRVRVADLTVGGLLWWLVGAVVTSLLVPGGSYLFVWPLLFGALGLLFTLRSPSSGSPWQGTLILALTALPALLLLAPTIKLLFIALTLFQVALVCAILALALGLFVPHLHGMMAAGPRWLLPGGAALVGLLFLVGGSLTSGFNAQRPQPTSLFYALNADSGSAVWASSNRSQDEWTRQYLTEAERAPLPEFFPGDDNAYWVSPTEAAPLPAPEVEVLEQSSEGDRHTLRLAIRSARGAPALFVSTDASAQVTAASVGGKPLISSNNLLPTGGGGWGFRYYGLPAEGFELELTVRATDSFTLRVMDVSFGLPEIPGQSLPTMPETMMAAPFTTSNLTLVSKTVQPLSQP